MSGPGTRHSADSARGWPDHNESMALPPLRSGALVASAGSPAGAAGAISNGSGSIRVLVVEDDPRVRAAIGQTIALEADLVMVAAVADRGAAMSFAESADPSVALVDVLVPDEVDGLALVRSLSRRADCAVVAMSVRSGLRGAALAAGAVAFVEKGGDIDAVLGALRAAACTYGA
jgi:DNA-binding NtrC family response regulator